MAHAFDNRNFIPIQQASLFRTVSPSGSKRIPIVDDDLRDESAKYPFNENNIPSKSNHHDPSRSSADFSTMTPTSYRIYSSPITIEHSPKLHRSILPVEEEHPTSRSPLSRSDTKFSLATPIPRISSIMNHDYRQRLNFNSSSPSSLSKMNPTYMTSTELYISQPSTDQIEPRTTPPPPPPPRYPLNPPVVPPRISSISNQRSSIMIPDFNSHSQLTMTNGSRESVYRSPVQSSSIVSEHPPTGNRPNSLLINTNQYTRDSIDGSSVGEFFGECGKCGELIFSSDDPCDVLGRVYHSKCAVCVICRRSVKNKYFYLKDDLYCEDDFLYTGFNQTLENCTACGQVISDTIIQALGKSYHISCFKCSKCSISLEDLPFVTDQYRNLFCQYDYHMTFGPRCHKCSNIIMPEEGSNETVRIVSMGKNFHLNCYRCEDCSIELNDEDDHRCYSFDDQLFCYECYVRRLGTVHKF